MRSLPKLGFLLLALVLLGGCKTAVKAPDIPEIYRLPARYEGVDRNPVIVVPGIMGSILEQEGTGVPVWGAFSGEFVDPETPYGAALAALPMAKGVPLSDLQDDVVSTGALDRLRFDLFGLPIELSAYANIMRTLGVGGYADEDLGRAGEIDYGDRHYTCFQFHYDWRRSNVENAALLDAFIQDKAEYVRQQRRERFGETDEPVRFDIVAHSMGGLITRYYLRYGAEQLPSNGSLPEITWEGAKHVEKAILVGTPNGGSTDSIHRLVDGLDLSILAQYDPVIIGTFPSLYELMPRGRQQVLQVDGVPTEWLEPTDPSVWFRFGWGLAADGKEAELARILPNVPVDQLKEIARDHLEKCLQNAQQFHEAIDRPASPPPGTVIELFAADSEPTPSLVLVDPATYEIRQTQLRPGDRTVLRTSALMDERVGQKWVPRLRSPIQWNAVTFIFSDHLGMTRDPVFTDNILYRLLEAPRPTQRETRNGL